MASSSATGSSTGTSQSSDPQAALDQLQQTFNQSIEQAAKVQTIEVNGETTLNPLKKDPNA